MTRAINAIRLRDQRLEAAEAVPIIDLLRARGAVLIGFGDSHNDTDVLLRWREVAGVARAADAESDGQLPVVLVCEKFESAQVSALVASGVCGVALLAEADRTLIPTIAAVGSGQICFPRSTAFGARPILSIREKQVLGLVALGLANSEVADRLVVSESTVKSHLTSSFAKLGVRSRHEAVDLLVNPQSGLGLGFLSLVPEAENRAASEEQ